LLQTLVEVEVKELLLLLLTVLLLVLLLMTKMPQLHIQQLAQ
jgi:hypothetical protein